MKRYEPILIGMICAAGFYACAGKSTSRIVCHVADSLADAPVVETAAQPPAVELRFEDGTDCRVSGAFSCGLSLTAENIVGVTKNRLRFYGIPYCVKGPRFADEVVAYFRKSGIVLGAEPFRALTCYMLLTDSLGHGGIDAVAPLDFGLTPEGMAGYPPGSRAFADVRVVKIRMPEGEMKRFLILDAVQIGE